MSLTIRERLAVHRRVERMRAMDLWPDWLDVADDALGAIAEMGLDGGLTKEARQLLADEVRREVADKVALDAQLEAYHELEEEVPMGPVDPFGELAGGRLGCVQLVCRRVDELADEAVLDGEVGAG